MNDDQRPDPDALLEALTQADSKPHRGKLKIFFGMSAGVGKTYAMLEAAHQRLTEGINVVIGYVETHHRAETDALVAGLPIISRKKLDYRGTMLEEMDIDAILESSPQLVLVDELAHTNAPGSNHPKRYMDILDLLAAGIDVYTTVNVQHLESRADTVQQITGITIRETVPDMLIDIADKIELIDLEPDELLKRLAEGKVYTPDRAQLAADNFFREGNLTALREMALRLTAEHVDQQMQDYMQVKRIQGPWKSVERLMVAVSPSPFSERLIRWTRRIAYSLKAQWFAVYVEPLRPLKDVQKAQLAHNLSMARKLGGEVISTSSDDPVKELIRIAQQRNVTQIIVGKHTRTSFQDLLSGGSLINRLVNASGDIDIYVVTGDKTETEARPLIVRPTMHSSVNQYLIATVVVLVAVGISYALLPLIGYQEVALVLLFVILLLANFLGRGPILVAAALSALLLDYFFIPPRLTLYVASLQDALILGLYFFIALVTGNLTARLSSQKKLLRLREDRTSALYTLAHEIAEAITLDDILRTVVDEVGNVFNAEIAMMLPDSLGRLPDTPHSVSTLALNQKELSVASWAFEHGQSAGRFTETLPTATAQYLPLVTPGGGVAGVMGVRMRDTEQLSVDQEALLQTFVSHIALAVERETLDAAAHRAEFLQESDRLHSTLLASVSQKLQTPLMTIDTAASHLLEAQNQGNAELQFSLGEDIKGAAQQLKGLVSNLLDMTRLESGHLKLNLQPCNVKTLIETSIQRMKTVLMDHDLIIEIADDLPLIMMDFALIEQVLVNLLDNVVKYTAAGLRVRITAKTEGNELVMSVADRGPGLPPADLTRVFDKFYHALGIPSTGVGLGLSIAKGLVEAHGGTISAENRPTHGGTRFTIRLPLLRQH